MHRAGFGLLALVALWVSALWQPACSSCDREGRRFACGVSTCTGAQHCCNDVCEDAVCPEPYDTNDIECDSADDCGEGQVCCSGANIGQNTTYASCRDACADNEVQLCRQDCECLDGTKCRGGGCVRM
jgi:hypothetical protein